MANSSRRYSRFPAVNRNVPPAGVEVEISNAELEKIEEEPVYINVAATSVKKLVEWIDGDKDRARFVLEAEASVDNPRKSLLAAIEAILSEK